MKVVISDFYYESIRQEQEILREAGCTLEAYRSSTEDELISRAWDCDALIVQFCPVTRNVVEHLKNCKVIVRYAIGYDTIDLAAADEAGIVVCNVPDYCVDDVATHAVTLLLACAKRLALYVRGVKQGRWDHREGKPLENFSRSTVGLVGFGAIAQGVAKKLSGFGCQILAYDPFGNPDQAKALGVRLVDLNTLLSQSDYLSLHCPLTKDTARLLDREAFSRMKPGVCIVNTARGGLIDEEALLWALNQGIVASAGLDVLTREPVSSDHPLLQYPNVLLTPHVAWYSEESVQKLQKQVAQEAARVLQGESPCTWSITPGRKGGKPRVCGNRQWNNKLPDLPCRGKRPGCGFRFQKVGVRDTSMTGSRDALRTGLRELFFSLLEREAISPEQIRFAVASGMITSEIGLIELPHIMAPAGLEELSQSICKCTDPSVLSLPCPVYFIRGVRNRYSRNCGIGDLCDTDFMRGKRSSAWESWKNSSRSFPAPL